MRDEKKRDTSWNKVAGWYDHHVSEESDFHKDLIIPGVLRLLDPKRGESVLDVGCGQGVMCREISNKGALVTGVDSSPKLIEIAKKKSANFGNAWYIVSDAADMRGLKNSTFDSVISVLALQNIEHLEKAVSEMSRVSKAESKLVIVMNHPCFRIPRQSGWGFDEKRKLQYRRVDRYISELKIPIQMHPGAAPSIHTWTFHRPVSAYINSLVKSGYMIDAFEEWVSHRKSAPGGRSRTENMSREEIPMFLALRARKVI